MTTSKDKQATTKNNADNSVDPRYGIPKRQKFVAFRDGGIPARKNSKTSTTSPLAQQLVKMHEKKYFDSADWVLEKEVAPVHPKVFTESAEEGDKKELKTVEEHSVERGVSTPQHTNRPIYLSMLIFLFLFNRGVILTPRIGL